MSQRDAFDLLRSLNPVDDQPLELGRDAAADDLLARILDDGADADVVSISVARRRRRWVVPTVVAGSVFVGGLGAAAWIASRHSSQPFSVGCRRAADEQSDTFVVALDGASSPVELCATPWVDGTFGTDGPPPLVACVDAKGFAVVIPGAASSDCAALKLAPYDEAPDPVAAAVVVADREIIAYLDSVPGRCVDLETAKVQFRTILDRNGLADWQLSSEGMIYEGGNTCITASFDVESKTVGLPGVTEEFIGG